jgi:hypothetical protein
MNARFCRGEQRSPVDDRMEASMKTLLAIFLTAGMLMAQTPAPKATPKPAIPRGPFQLTQETVGQAFTIPLAQMAGAQTCTAIPRAVRTVGGTFTADAAGLHGTMSQPGYLPVLVHCTWTSGKAATTLVRVVAKPIPLPAKIVPAHPAK